MAAYVFRTRDLNSHALLVIMNQIIPFTPTQHCCFLTPLHAKSLSLNATHDKRPVFHVAPPNQKLGEGSPAAVANFVGVRNYHGVGEGVGSHFRSNTAFG